VISNLLNEVFPAFVKMFALSPSQLRKAYKRKKAQKKLNVHLCRLKEAVTDLTKEVKESCHVYNVVRPLEALPILASEARVLSFMRYQDLLQVDQLKMTAAFELDTIVNGMCKAVSNAKMSNIEFEGAAEREFNEKCDELTSLLKSQIDEQKETRWHFVQALRIARWGEEAGGEISDHFEWWVNMKIKKIKESNKKCHVCRMEMTSPAMTCKQRCPMRVCSPGCADKAEKTTHKLFCRTSSWQLTKELTGMTPEIYEEAVRGDDDHHVEADVTHAFGLVDLARSRVSAEVDFYDFFQKTINQRNAPLRRKEVSSAEIDAEPCIRETGDYCRCYHKRTCPLDELLDGLAPDDGKELPPGKEYLTVKELKEAKERRKERLKGVPKRQDDAKEDGDESIDEWLSKQAQKRKGV